MQIIRRDYPGCAIARPFGIGNWVSGPTETIRNDFFVYLKSASLDKTAVRKEYQNIEVEISLRDSTGEPVRAYFYSSTAAPTSNTFYNVFLNFSSFSVMHSSLAQCLRILQLPWLDGSTDIQYTSTVYYSKSQPRWCELIRFALSQCPQPPARLPLCDSRFSQTDSLMDGAGDGGGDEIEPFVPASSSCSSMSSGTSTALPLSAHLRFVVRNRSTATGALFCVSLFPQ